LLQRVGGGDSSSESPLPCITFLSSQQHFMTHRFSPSCMLSLSLSLYLCVINLLLIIILFMLIPQKSIFPFVFYVGSDMGSLSCCGCDDDRLFILRDRRVCLWIWWCFLSFFLSFFLLIALHHHCTITAPSLRHHCAITAPSLQIVPGVVLYPRCAVSSSHMHHWHDRCTHQPLCHPCTGTVL